MPSCTHCGSSVGDDAKIQPTNCDGDTWCPPCFVTRRMQDDPDRFNPTQAAAVRCQFCGWLSVSFGARSGGRLKCGHCGHFGALLLRLDKLPLTGKEARAIEELARESGVKNPRRLEQSRRG